MLLQERSDRLITDEEGKPHRTTLLLGTRELLLLNYRCPSHIAYIAMLFRSI